MITIKEFDNYKQFREQSSCPFCRQNDIPYGDGLYWCWLDKNCNLMKELTAPVAFWAMHCDRCGRYWIDSASGKLTYDNIFPAEMPASKPPIDLKPTDAMKILAQKTYEFFEIKYKVSSEFREYISGYSKYRVMADMTTLSGGERVQSIEQPLMEYRNRIDEFLFDALKESLMKKFPYRSFYQVEASKLFKEEEFAEKLARLLLDKLMNSFLTELFYLLKNDCKAYIRSQYPAEYSFIFDDPDNKDGYYNELYGRAVGMIAETMQSLGLSIPSNIREVHYGSVTIYGNKPLRNNIVFGDIIARYQAYKAKIGKQMQIEINETEANKIDVEVSEKAVHSVKKVQVGKCKAESIKVKIGEPTEADFRKALYEIQESGLKQDIIDECKEIISEAIKAVKENDIKGKELSKGRFKSFVAKAGKVSKFILECLADIATVRTFFG